MPVKLTPDDVRDYVSRDTRPWSEWGDGDPWKFAENEDYAPGFQSEFIKHARYEMRKRGYKISIIHRDSGSFTMVAQPMGNAQ